MKVEVHASLHLYGLQEVEPALGCGKPNCCSQGGRDLPTTMEPFFIDWACILSEEALLQALLDPLQSLSSAAFRHYLAVPFMPSELVTEAASGGGLLTDLDWPLSPPLTVVQGSARQPR